MNEMKKSVSPKTEIKITVFQALTLLAKQYRFDESNKETYEKVKTLYLSGVRSTDNTTLLNNLLQDELLTAYIVSTDKKDINEDPVRRYFESKLCHKTLMRSLDLLDIQLLEGHFNAILGLLTIEARENFLMAINNATRVNEYTEGIRILDLPESYQSFKPEQKIGQKSTETLLTERKKKMKVLAKCAYSATQVDERSKTGRILLDIYNKKNSVYSTENRGRILRVDPSTGKKQTVRPYTLGIMKAYMPLATTDTLYAENVARYTRAADMRSYAQGSYKIPDQMFSTKVTPFINSISGTMLINLRVIAQLLNEHKFVYQVKKHYRLQRREQFKYFLKSFVAYLLYHTGGHSLDEYMSVLQLPEVQQEFKKLHGFSSITLDHLFKHENIIAFDHALDQTIEYNDIILNRIKLHDELLQHHKRKDIWALVIDIMRTIMPVFYTIIAMLVLHSIIDEKNKPLIDSSPASAAGLGRLIVGTVGTLFYCSIPGAPKQNEEPKNSSRNNLST